MSFLSLLGVAALVYLVGTLGLLLYRTFIYKCDLSQFQSPKKDAWALVTGCTSGIGEGFAHMLAQRGFNVLLVSRSESKLKELQATLKAKYPAVKTDYAISDATSLDPKNITAVVEAASKVNLRILINNVGVSTENPTLYEHTQLSDLESMILVNCRYSTVLTQKIIPLLRKGGRSAIVNLASQSSYLHPAYLTVYGATKAYNLAFSNGLRDELAEDNITVLALSPGFVVSAMTRIPRTSLSVCSAEVCATSGLNAIGLREHCGYWYHQLFLQLTLLIPASVRGPITVKFMKDVAAKKAKYAKKAAAAQ